MTKDDILSAIRSVARRLRRAPTRAEFTRLSGISHFKVLGHFPSLRDAIRRAGFEPHPQGRRISTAALLEDWARVALKLGKTPSRSEYLRRGRYSGGVFTLRFGSWTATPRSLIRFARNNNLEEEWGDVLRLVNDGRFENHVRLARDQRRDAALSRLILEPSSASVPAPDGVPRLEPRRDDATSLRPSSSLERKKRGDRTSLPPPVAGLRCVTRVILALIVNTLAPQEASSPGSGPAAENGHSLLQYPDYQITQLTNPGGVPVQRALFRDRAVLGAPLSLAGLAHEPVNETGVVFLFGMLAHHLGFQVEALQAGFPDCEAIREVQPGKWQRVRIEFEFESRNFHAHRHATEACDVIICWRHNWPACPETIDVVELSGVVRQERI